MKIIPVGVQADVIHVGLGLDQCNQAGQGNCFTCPPRNQWSDVYTLPVHVQIP